MAGVANGNKLCYRFAEYCLYPHSFTLLRNNQTVAVPGRALDTLIALIEGHGSVLTKAELMAKVWGDAEVEENNLTQQIGALRRLFGDEARTQRFIATVPGRGYRFVCPLEAIEDTGPPPPSK